MASVDDLVARAVYILQENGVQRSQSSHRAIIAKARELEPERMATPGEGAKVPRWHSPV